MIVLAQIAVVVFYLFIGLFAAALVSAIVP
jgi:hypothetical protein